MKKTGVSPIPPQDKSHGTPKKSAPESKAQTPAHGTQKPAHGTQKPAHKTQRPAHKTQRPGSHYGVKKQQYNRDPSLEPGHSNPAPDQG